MPLQHGASKATRNENIAEMVQAGHNPRQAVAAAYRQQRDDIAKYAHHPPSEEAAHGSRKRISRSR